MEDASDDGLVKQAKSGLSFKYLALNPDFINCCGDGIDLQGPVRSVVE